jgi:N-methylhydantoinase A
MAVHLAIDIGGTFTDIVAREGDAVSTTKVPTTPANLVDGVREGIDEILAETEGARSDVSRFVHGTTAGTNAILEREGGTVGLLMTEGFRDTLSIGRQKRNDMYDLFLDPQTPTFLAPRERRVGIEERVDDEGSVLTPLDESQVLSAVDELVTEHGVDAVAVCYLFSFENPEHERRTEELIAERYPDVHVSRSSTVNPKFREYERLVVTAFDAYLRPVMDDYIRRMNDLLDEQRIDAELEIMQSRGGLTSTDLILEKPVGTILSGPAAAVAGASDVGEQMGYPDLITIDMGGTSSDVSLIEDGDPHISSEGEIQEYPLRIPMVDISTIGSGGGSIAWLDEADSLHVGPRSAGADPGPACYGRGGTEPTVTDASLVLGYLNPGYFADGSLELDVDAAREAIRTKVAEPLGYGVVEAAKGIHSIVNTQLSEQLRLNTVQRGYDPREFDLFAMGGAGPIHAGHLAEALGVRAAVVPRSPGVLSASGLLSADVEHDHETTYVRLLEDVPPSEVQATYETLEARGHEAMEREGVPPEETRSVRQADMRYHGQSFEIELEIPEGPLTPAKMKEVREAFHDRHERVYGHRDPSASVEFVNLRTVRTFTPEKHEVGPAAAGDSLADAEKGRRELRFVGHDGGRDAPVYDRRRLPPGAEFDGPAVVEQSDTTTVVYPGQSCSVDASGNLVVSTDGA